jgi:hypothetical protein
MAENVVTTQMTQALLSTMDVVAPDKQKKLFRKYGNQAYEHFFMLRTMGFKLKATNRTYSHWEDRHILETITVDGNTSASATDGAAVVIPVADPFDADGNYYPRVNDELLFEGPLGDVQGIIIGIDPDPANPSFELTVTVVPASATKRIPALTDGQEIMFMGNTHSQGGGQPEGRQSKVQEFSNTLKIIKETKGAEGSALNDETWFDLYQMETIAPLPNGKTWGYYRKAIMDLDHEMACWFSGMFLFGEQVTNTLAVDTTNNNRRLHGTKGLFTESAERGHPFGYIPGTLSVPHFDTWNFIYEQEYNFGTEVMLYFGTELYDETQNMLTDFGRYTDMTLVTAARGGVKDAFFGGKEAWEMSVGFEYFNKSGRSYLMKKLTTFSNVKQYGALGYSKTKTGIILPVMWDKDPRTGEEIPTMGYRYSEQGGYNREYEIWTDGAAGGQEYIKYNGPIDAIKHYVRSEVGSEQYACNRNIVVTPT